MDKIIYNKLVKDKILKAIEDSGQECHSSILNDNKYIKMLNKLLVDNTQAYINNENIETFAEVIEVLEAIAIFKKFQKKDIQKLRTENADKFGKYDNKIFLHEIIKK